MSRVERDGTIIAGVDAPIRSASDQASFNLQPDPASLKDLAARLRHDAATASDKAQKARFLASAQDAENRAEQIEAAALWTIPARR